MPHLLLNGHVTYTAAAQRLLSETMHTVLFAKRKVQIALMPCKSKVQVTSPRVAETKLLSTASQGGAFACCVVHSYAYSHRREQSFLLNPA